MRKVDIKLGYSCNNNCIHCVITDHRETCKSKGFSEDLSTEQYIKEMKESRERGAELIVITGGEPTIRKDLLIIIKKAFELGYGITMQTNGRRFNDIEFVQSLCELGAIDYCIAIHGPDEDIHDAITRAAGSFNETVSGLKNLINSRQKVTGKIVISKKNAAYLKETAKLLIELGLKSVNITFPHGMGNAGRYFLEVVPTYTEILDSIHRTLFLLESHEISIGTEALTYCLMTGFENYVIDLSNLNREYTELKQHGTDEVIDWNKKRVEIKKKFPQCLCCRYDLICEGPWIEYPHYYGESEFVAIPGEKITHPDEVIKGKGRHGLPRFILRDLPVETRS